MDLLSQMWIRYFGEVFNGRHTQHFSTISPEANDGVSEPTGYTGCRLTITTLVPKATKRSDHRKELKYQNVDFSKASHLFEELATSLCFLDSPLTCLGSDRLRSKPLQLDVSQMSDPQQSQEGVGGGGRAQRVQKSA